MTSTLVPVALLVAVVAAVRGLWSPCGLSVLSSLNPVSESARGHRFGVTAGWYVAGAAAGGAILGGGCALLAGLFGQLHAPDTVVWGRAGVAALLAVASDSGVRGRTLPVHPRQVDERWLTAYRRWIYAGGYGVQIGAGFATYIMTAAVYLSAVLAVLTGSPAAAFAVGLTFGVVRGLAILVSVPARTPQRLRAVLARVDGLTRASILLAGAGEALAASAAGWALVGQEWGGRDWRAPALAAALLLGCAAVFARTVRRRALVLS